MRWFLRAGDSCVVASFSAARNARKRSVSSTKGGDEDWSLKSRCCAMDRNPWMGVLGVNSTVRGKGCPSPSELSPGPSSIAAVAVDGGLDVGPILDPLR